ncbi:MAG: fluoride efflux transporter CrcB [Pseudonocardia sp.]|nr:fluoride efflux transporter CrcB [Pseudonocardia sp.]
MSDAPSAGGGHEATPPPRLLEPLAGQGAALAVVAAGGALGAAARYGIGVALPQGPGSFPLTTFLINVVGCLVLGGLVAVVGEWTRAHPLVRPFVVTGVLGGFTTFSAYTAEAQELLRAGRVATAGAYLAGTLLAAVTATWLGIRLARAARPGARR